MIVTKKQVKVDELLKVVTCEIEYCYNSKHWNGWHYAIGTATCSPLDTFDITTGRRIAVMKAFAKAGNNWHKHLMRDLFEITEHLKNSDKCSAKLKHELLKY